MNKFIKTNKKKVLIVVSCLTVVALVTSVSFYYINQSQAAAKAEQIAALRQSEETNLNITFVKSIPDLEYGSSFDSERLVLSTNGVKVSADPKEIDTSTLGEKVILFTVQSRYFSDITKTFEVKLNVVDTTPPEISGAKDITIKQDGDLDLWEGIAAIDNYDGDVTENIVTEGEYNTSKVGVYNITYKVTDSSGNETAAAITLTVEKKNSPTPSPSPNKTGDTGTGTGSTGTSDSGTNSGTDSGSTGTGSSSQACPGGYRPDLPCDYIMQADYYLFIFPTLAACDAYGDDWSHAPEEAISYTCQEMHHNDTTYAGWGFQYNYH
ncbi:MAG: DUF5011 domain-containing protein [Erysipelotrichaceae bacterium]|jgi:hypothetical protein|nr:DUF5011 domain-containing protein [Erysipelotrichaceae bacterium]